LPIEPDPNHRSKPVGNLCILDTSGIFDVFFAVSGFGRGQVSGDDVRYLGIHDSLCTSNQQSLEQEYRSISSSL
jgi:hypothetical protein